MNNIRETTRAIYTLIHPVTLRYAIDHPASSAQMYEALPRVKSICV